MKKYSRIIAGAMTWGEWGKKFSTLEMTERIHHCIEQGITTFDHADIYGGYSTEDDFGNALEAANLKRNDIQIISKCGIQLLVPNRNSKVKHYDLSKDYIIWSAENSLKKLKTEYLDLLLLHRPSPLMNVEEILEAERILKKQGKIKEFGVSNFTSSQMRLLENRCEVAVNQIEFSLTACDAMLDGTLDQMRIQNIIPMAWSPLGSIFKNNDLQTKRIKELLGNLTEKYNATEDQLLLAWILKHPSKIHPVIGTTDKQRMTDAANALSIQLDREDWFLLLEASQGQEVA
ncbi:Predicted oxidoreductase [Flavobacteriaceae bacterium MAR_2010_188]|nr:Predicted oxidoreductase [Flavobacteriaceae bacterium MAR_2010_188]